MITQEELVKIFKYDEDSGIFTYISKRGKKNIGDTAGSYMTNGYVTIGINGKAYLAHRLAFLFMTGEFPPEQTDHINQVRDDNRWCNLATKTNQENSCNHTLRSTNSSGWTGVCWGKREQKWRARIMVHGVEKYLGTYHDIDEAVASRKEANLKYGFHENHGKHKEKIY